MMRTAMLFGCSLLVFACSSSDDQPEPQEEEIIMGTGDACESDSECNDGAVCNGTESCKGGFCLAGDPLQCDDGIECTTDSCSHLANGCVFVPVDEDGDGHADADCRGPDGEPLGDDCDDSDPNRYPGNAEVCSPDDAEHDEDCDPLTFGNLDVDADGFTDTMCCNKGDDDSLNCGVDCDDSNPSMFPDHPEICDEIDNNCDGEVDVNTAEVPWYPDADGDHFGRTTEDPVMSCQPLEGHALRPTDCDDMSGAAHPAAREVCDGIDNDCDGMIDEEGVCACAPEGNVRACACVAGGTGVQSCDSGRWNTCDCTECVDGVMDCVAGIIPRMCVNGRYQTGTACGGARALGNAGQCVCPDGSLDCVDVMDIVPPTVIASSILPGAQISAGSQIALVFSEPVMPSSINGSTISLQDGYGDPIALQYQAGGSNVLLTPDSVLPPGMNFTLEVHPGVTDLAGNAGLGNYTLPLETLPAEIPLTLPTTGPNLPVSGNIAPDNQGGGLLLVRTGNTDEQTGLTAYPWLATDWDYSSPIEIFAPRNVGHFESDMAIDGNGNALVVYSTEPDGWSSGDPQPVRRVLRTNNIWSAAEDVPDSTELGYPVAAAGGTTLAHSTFTLLEGTSASAFVIQDGVVGGSTAGVFTDMHRLAVNGSGAAAMVGRDDSSLSVFTVSAVGTWSSRGQLLNNSFFFDLGVRTDGSVLVCYELSNQVHCEDTLPDASPSSEFDPTNGLLASASLTAPSVAVDGNNLEHILMVQDYEHLIAFARDNQVLAPHGSLDVPGSGSISQLEVRASNSGRAVAVWIQSDSTEVANLYAAEFTGGAWQKAQKLEEASDDVARFDFVMDQTTGIAWITFATAGEIDSYVRTTRF